MLIETIKNGSLDNYKNSLIFSIAKEHVMENPQCDQSICPCKGCIPKLIDLYLLDSHIYFKENSDNADEEEKKKRDTSKQSQEKIVFDGVNKSTFLDYSIYRTVIL